MTSAARFLGLFALFPEMFGDGFGIAIVKEEFLANGNVAASVHTDSRYRVTKHSLGIAVHGVFSLRIVDKAHFVAGFGTVNFLL